MKIASLFLACGLAAGMAGCSSSEPAVVVGSDQRGDANQAVNPYGSVQTTPSPNDVDFTKYKTYSWASQVRNENNTTYFLNDLVFKAMVRDAVDHEMVSRGYTYSPDGGDLLLNFRVFDQPTEIRSNENLGNGYWGTSESYAYNPRNQVKLDQGSILVQMIDRRESVEVWQGYASGLTNGNAFDKDKNKVYAAVGQIFNKYQYRGDKL
ncbi:DUF4136 domain-containing protein [Hymenobacter aerilatus]|uniref:DUF4136 domain-containing protein n=1 Tax=Hymenobacter aerilatus TaxID=2932251 RepID=A0A8T9SXQ4_9BACT|nr:DUF4136 domain-containing protein [Hymenobacter aerilatus]UOR06497.1 DUF4136 domain-containing protein [Hymenobacter aerilatus]